MKKFTTLAIAAALAAALTLPTAATANDRQEFIPFEKVQFNSLLLFSKVEFVSNGGTELKPAIACLGMTLDLSEYLPEREGYTFTGWYADEELTKAVTEFKAGDLRKLFAGWEEIVEVEETEDEDEAEAETDTADEVADETEAEAE